MTKLALKRRASHAGSSEAALTRITRRRRNAPSPSGPSLGERAYQALRQAIQEARIEPGTHLTEADVAEWLQMSRTPVREAMRRLESDGVLVTQPFRGAVVVSIEEPQLRELYAVRELLEVAAAGWCADNATAAEIRRMREIIDEESKATRDPRTLIHLNRELHRQICQGAHNEFLLKALATVHSSFALLGKSNLLKEQRARDAIAEHGRIVSAIEKRDRRAAEAAARAHVRTSFEQRLKQIASQKKART